MNRKWLVVFLGIGLIGLIIINFAASKDEITEVEDQNTYRWQRFMNEEEFNKLKQGMYYIDVVKIAGGSGVKIDEGIYEWNDEILLTKGYQVHFQDGKLIKTVTVKRKGHSNR